MIQKMQNLIFGIKNENDKSEIVKVHVNPI